MSGLIEKDIRLILQRKKYMLMLAAMAVCLSFAMDDSFITSYMAMIGLVFALTTLSYDEYDNGLPFIFTLPISRRDYAFEKQIFGYACVVTSWICGVVIQFVVSMVTGKPYDLAAVIPGALIYLAAFMIILAIMMPLELHFGMEKSRIAMLIVFGGFFLVGILGPKIAAALNLDLSPAAETIKNLPKATLIGGGVAITLVIMVISFLITIKIMEKKEF